MARPPASRTSSSSVCTGRPHAGTPAIRNRLGRRNFTQGSAQKSRREKVGIDNPQKEKKDPAVFGDRRKVLRKF
jgi:hypothetical protein